MTNNKQLKKSSSERRIINIPSSTTLSYLSVLNFLFQMTPKELEVMAEFVDWEQKIRRDNLDLYTFGTSIRQTIANKLEISNINTYIVKLKRKQAIKEKDNKLIVNPLLVLRESNEIVFRFRTNHK